MAFVYLHKNKTNDKVYVGITDCNSVEERWGKNGKNYFKGKSKDNKNTRFKDALLKYGWDNFDHIILKEGISIDDANIFEKYYIDLYDSYNPNKGYNMTRGGMGTEGHVKSKEVRKKLSEATRKQHLENGHPFQNKFGVNAARVKGVVKISMDGSEIEICPSIIEQARKYGMRTTNIAACCNHRQKSAKGFHWMYEEEYNKHVESGTLMDEISRLNKIEVPADRKVHKKCFIAEGEDGSIYRFKNFESVETFLKERGFLSASHVLTVIRGNRKKAYGFKWREE